MPKPLFGDNGSGMHCHQSIWKGEQAALRRRGGLCRPVADVPLLYRRPAASTPRRSWPSPHPTTNSYRRLVPGYEAPVNLAWSMRNRSACCRIPMYSDSPKAQAGRVPLPRPVLQPLPRLRGDDDGRPGRHSATGSTRATRSTRTSTTSPPEEAAEIKKVPGSLADASRRSRRTTSSCSQGDVFTPDFIDTYIDYKRDVGDRPDPAAAAPLRVLPLLRHLRRRPASAGRGRGPRGPRLFFHLQSDSVTLLPATSPQDATGPPS